MIYVNLFVAYKSIEELIAENPVVRGNLMNEPGYTGYCGSAMNSGCSWPRTEWQPALSQFKCPECGWISCYPIDFIEHYRKKWNK